VICILRSKGHHPKGQWSHQELQIYVSFFVSFLSFQSQLLQISINTTFTHDCLGYRAGLTWMSWCLLLPQSLYLLLAFSSFALPTIEDVLTRAATQRMFIVCWIYRDYFWKQLVAITVENYLVL
jgi:hypothetical protein